MISKERAFIIREGGMLLHPPPILLHILFSCGAQLPTQARVGGEGARVLLQLAEAAGQALLSLPFHSTAHPR